MSSTQDDHLQFNEITRGQFKLYTDIQRSGKVNMADWRTIEIDTFFELDHEIQRVIHAHYRELSKKYGIAV